MTPSRPSSCGAPARASSGCSACSHTATTRESRYIDTRKARLQAAWTAALVNLNPIGRHLTAHTA